MIEVKIRKPQCYGRPCYLYCKGNIPEKVKGKTLLPERRYCAGQKRIRQFRSSDPKVYVPAWCPLRKAPAELRIYCFKSGFVCMLQDMLRRDGAAFYPSGADYALRYEGTTEFTAAQFYQELRAKSASEILNTMVHVDEIVEIDDGLSPYYFFFSENRSMPYVVRFDSETARKNQLEMALESTDNGSRDE